MPLDVAASERKDRHKLQLAALDVVERGGDQPGSDATSSGELLVDECVVAMPVGVVDDAEVAPLAVTIQAHCDPSLLPKHPTLPPALSPTERGPAISAGALAAEPLVAKPD